MNHTGISPCSGRRFRVLYALSCLVLVMLAALSLPRSILLSDACAGTVPVTRLVNDKKLYDGREITIQGEVVGDVMERSAGVWLNVDDGTESIGVWVPRGIMPTMKYVGGYTTQGDIIKVEGTFYRACGTHGGETDIHASGITRVHPGYPVAHSLSSQKIRWALVLLFCAVALIGVHWWTRRPH
ncbi:MAG: hypothetical protein ACMUIL_10175 [bacterium]